MLQVLHISGELVLRCKRRDVILRLLVESHGQVLRARVSSPCLREHHLLCGHWVLFRSVTPGCHAWVGGMYLLLAKLLWGGGRVAPRGGHRLDGAWTAGGLLPGTGDGLRGAHSVGQ